MEEKGAVRELSMVEAVEEEEVVGGKDGEVCRGNGMLTTRSTSRTRR